MRKKIFIILILFVIHISSSKARYIHENMVMKEGILYHRNTPYTGIVKENYDYGGLKSESNYENGKKHGLEKEYYNINVLNDQLKKIYEENHELYKEAVNKLKKDLYMGGFGPFGLFNSNLEIRYPSMNKFNNDQLILKNEKYWINGIMEGTYKEYGSSGELWYEVTYQNNKKKSPGKRYVGSYSAIENYIDGKLEGKVLTQDASGKVFAENNYKNDMLNGEAKAYYNNGQILIECYYENDKTVGKAFMYYEDGKIAIEMYYKNGELDGKVLGYKYDGDRTIINEANYKKGVLDGKYIEHKDKGGLLEIDYDNGKEIRKHEIKYTDTSIFSDDRFKYSLHGEKYTFDKVDISKKDNKLDGKYIAYYNDKIVIETNFIDDVENGTRIEHIDGKIYRIMEIKGGKIDGVVIIYHDNGKISKKYDSIEDKFNGKFEEFYYNGNNKLKVTYKNGERHGEYNMYHENSQLCESGNYESGNKEGVFKEYYSSGKLMSEKVFQNDKAHGKYVIYYKDGSIEEERNYMNGKLDGIYKKYHPNGQINIKCNYSLGILDGEYEEYYSNGQLTTKIFYIAGNANGIEKAYHPNGKLMMEINWKIGKEDGEYHEYYDDGQLRLSCNYVDGLIDGIYKLYHKNGNIRCEILYKLDNPEGSVNAYYENGKIEIEHNFKDGKLDGIQKFYYINGNLKEEENYKEGKKIEY